jgi:hypothetical protein
MDNHNQDNNTANEAPVSSIGNGWDTVVQRSMDYYSNTFLLFGVVALFGFVLGAAAVLLNLG